MRMKKNLYFFGAMLFFAFAFILFNFGIVKGQTCVCDNFTPDLVCPSGCNCDSCPVACGCTGDNVCVNGLCQTVTQTQSTCPYYYFTSSSACSSGVPSGYTCQQIPEKSTCTLSCGLDTCSCLAGTCVVQYSGTYIYSSPLSTSYTCGFSFKEDNNCDGFIDKEYYPLKQCTTTNGVCSVWGSHTCKSGGTNNACPNDGTACYCCNCPADSAWTCKDINTKQRTTYSCTGNNQCVSATQEVACASNEHCLNGICERKTISCSMPSNPHTIEKGESVTFSLTAVPSSGTCTLTYGNGQASFSCGDASKTRTYDTAGTYYPKYNRDDGTTAEVNCGTLVVNDTTTSSAQISVDPGYRDFGQVQTGSYADRTFTVWNVGSAGTTLTGGVDIGTSDFSCVSGCSYSLSAGSSQTTTIRFSPTSTGAVSVFPFFSGSGQSVQVDGEGVEEEISKSITMSQPTGSDNWLVDSTQTIAWSYTGSISNVNIRLSRNGGSSWDTLISNIANTGFYEWTVTEPTTSSAVIRVVDSSDSGVYGDSGTFTISDEGDPIVDECDLITLCGNYDTEETCNADDCAVADFAGGLCDDPDYVCACEWNNGECVTVARCVTNCEERGDGTCTYRSSTIGTSCKEGAEFMTLEITAEWKWTNGTIGFNSACVGGKRTLECPAQIALPFFNFQTFIIAVLVIAGVYLVLGMSKKGRKKK